MNTLRQARRMIGPFNPYTGTDVASFLDRQAEKFADRSLLLWEPTDGEPRSYSYAELADLSRRVAGGLAAEGIGRGDAVIIHLNNCPEFLIAYFACARLGALAVTTNTGSTAEEFEYFVSHSRARAIVTQPEYSALAVAARQRIPAVAWVAVTGEAAAPADAIAFSRLVDAAPFGPGVRHEPSAPCSVMYTSGTTSRPKGVVWSQANVLWGANINATHMRIGPDDCVMVFLPLFHTVGFCWNVLGTIASGGRFVLCNRFSSSRFWELAARHRCTWAHMVGFTLEAVINQPDPDQHDFRFWTCGGDLPVPRDRWGIRTIGVFGMTELITQPIQSDFEREGPAGAMGKVNPEYEVELRIGAEPAPPGVVADLWIRGISGLSVFDSYLFDPEATAGAFDEDGWFNTGDNAIGHEDGQIFYAGRAKDMLKVGGENVAAVEIENVIRSVEGVYDVAVVGRPDPMFDEVPVAFVIARGAGADLARLIEARCSTALSAFKRPRDIHLVDELPRGTLDKILKRELRIWAIERAAAQADSEPVASS